MAIFIDIPRDEYIMCIICQDCKIIKDIESYHLFNEIKSINDFEGLIKNCNCKYSVHFNCINIWLETKSICTMCLQPMSFSSEPISIQLNDVSNQSTVITQDIDYYRRRCYCCCYDCYDNECYIRAFLIIIAICIILLFAVVPGY